MKSAWVKKVAFGILAIGIAVSVVSTASMAATTDSKGPKKGLFGGDATKIKNLKTLNPKAIKTAAKLQQSGVLKTLTSNPNTVKALGTMGKMKLAKAPAAAQQ